jgi:hypothetical protein
MKTNWIAFKNHVISQGSSIQYTWDDNYYYMWLITSKIFCDVPQGTDDAVDFETNFKQNGNKSATNIIVTDGSGNALNQIDTDNAQIVRIKAAKKGWTYTATAFEFITAKVGSMIALNIDATSKSWVTIKLYDVNGIEITDSSLESTAVRTHVDFEPPYDYEVIGGEMRITPLLSTDMRLFIVAVPDVPYASGGSRVMAENLNLRFLVPVNMFQVDGRVSKFLQYNSTYHTNKLRLVFWHAAGIQENLMVTIEHFRQ